MKLFLFLLLGPLFVMTNQEPAGDTGNGQGIDQGVAQGTLQVNEKKITLRHAYARLHDNAEGALDEAWLIDAVSRLRPVPRLPRLRRRTLRRGLQLLLDRGPADNLALAGCAVPDGRDTALIELPATQLPLGHL